MGSSAGRLLERWKTVSVKENLRKAYRSMGIMVRRSVYGIENHKTAELGSRETEAIKGFQKRRSSVLDSRRHGRQSSVT